MTSTAKPCSLTTSPLPAIPAGNGTHGSESSNWPANAPSFTPIFPSGLQSISVTLPWPPKELSPNARVHHKAKARVAKTYREAAWALTKAAKLTGQGAGSVALEITFYWPDRRKRDLDNCLASIKSGLDGIADALGINDRQWQDIRIRVSPDIGGMVKVEIRQ